MKSLATAVLAAAALLAPSASATAQAAPTVTLRTADAGSWSEVKLPFLIPSAALKDIGAQSAESVWVGGFQGYFCVTWWTTCLVESKGSPVVRQWNGTDWKEYPLLGLLGTERIKTVAASGDEAWVLGDVHPPFPDLARFNGTAFVHVSGPADRDVELLRVNPAGVWIVGQDQNGAKLYRRAGDTWQETPVPAAMQRIRDVQALGADDAWAVGDMYDSGARRTVPILARWDGTAWQAVPSPTEGPAADTRFTHVNPVAEDDVWVTAPDFLLHWKSGEWQVVPKPEDPYDRDLGETVVDRNGVVWVASCLFLETGCLLNRYDAGGWTRTEVEFKADLRLSVVPGTNTIVASGNKGEDPGVTAVPNDPSVLILRR